MSATYYVMMAIMIALTAYNLCYEWRNRAKSRARTVSIALNAAGCVLCSLSVILAICGVG